MSGDFRRKLKQGITISLPWLMGLALAGWVALSLYIAVNSAADTYQVNMTLTAIHEEKSILELEREDVRDRVRVTGLEISGTPTPTGQPKEVLAPSPDALLKEEIRKRKLIKPGERIVALPETEQIIPTRLESTSMKQTPRTPLEAWLLLLGLRRPGQR